MKNLTLAFALSAASMIAIPLIGHAAANKSGFFVNGAIGRADLDNGFYDDRDTSYSIDAGYRWALAPAFAFGIEAGYTDLGSFSPNFVSVTTPTSSLLIGKAEIRGPSLGVNGHWNLSDTWYLSGRTGLFNAGVKGNFMDAGSSFQTVDHRTKAYAGVGIGYDFSDQFGLGLNYDRYKVGFGLDTDVASVSGEFRF